MKAIPQQVQELLNAGHAIKLWEMVELTIPPGTIGRIKFDTQAQLRNQLDQRVWIRNIELYPVTTYANSQNDNSIVGMPVADIPKAVLVLYAGGWEKIHMIPLAKLYHINDQNAPFQPWMQFFDTLEDVQWDKSYVQFSSASSGDDPYIIAFGVTYIKADSNGALIP